MKVGKGKEEGLGGKRSLLKISSSGPPLSERRGRKKQDGFFYFRLLEILEVSGGTFWVPYRTDADSFLKSEIYIFEFPLISFPRRPLGESDFFMPGEERPLFPSFPLFILFQFPFSLSSSLFFILPIQAFLLPPPGKG